MIGVINIVHVCVYLSFFTPVPVFASLGGRQRVVVGLFIKVWDDFTRVWEEEVLYVDGIVEPVSLCVCEDNDVLL